MYIAITIGFTVAGLLVLYSERKLIRQAICSYKWRTTEATVVDSADASFTTPGIDRNTSVGSVAYRETAHIFEYEVAGRVYRTTTYCFGAHVEQASAAFLIGTKVRIYYDAKDPTHAVVRRGFQPSMFLGPFLIAVAIYLFAQWLFLK